MPVSGDIQKMFGAIATRYDALNRILSLGTDRAWRNRTCEALGVSASDSAVDLCCGTGDLALSLSERGARVVGADFSREMLSIAASKGVGQLAEADCLHLPFLDSSFDVATVAFGVRNLADLDTGLTEIFRILKPGGRVGILEFARPRGPIFRSLYYGYLRSVVPSIGAIISGRRSAYRYLSDSIRQFPPQEKMKGRLRDAGFASVRHIDFIRGIAALYIGSRPADH